MWLKQRCNEVKDCNDGSDELHCGEKSVHVLIIQLMHYTASNADKCASNQFQCNDSSCVMSFELCDGVTHCADLSDEVNCGQWFVFDSMSISS